jgi:hypothetical protein
MSSSEEKRKVSNLLKEEILKALVEPSYYTDVNETLKGRKCWRVSGHVFESMSKILLAISGVLSFAAGVYDDKILSFVAGTLSTVSLATFQFSLYSFKMHKKNSYELNQLLEKLDIDTLPVFGSSGKNVEEQYQESYEPQFMCKQEESPLEKLSPAVVEKVVVTNAYKIKDLDDEKNKQDLGDFGKTKDTEEKTSEEIEMQPLNPSENV